MTDSHFILPDGNVQIAFSGGRTSAYMLRRILDANDLPLDRVKVIFTNTGREMPQTLDFVEEISSRWSISITWLEYRCRFTGAEHNPKAGIFDSAAHSFDVVSHNSCSRDGEPFTQLMEYFGYPPNRVSDFCSHELKTRTARRYCVSSLGWSRWTTALGIRHDEQARMLKKQPKERYRVWYPLAPAEVTKRTVSEFWGKQDFDLRLPNINGVTPLGNCDGCFKKSELKRAVLARDYPDRAAWWAESERKFFGTFREREPWDGMIDMVDRQADWIFDSRDSLCQADDGECT